MSEPTEQDQATARNLVAQIDAWLTANGHTSDTRQTSPGDDSKAVTIMWDKMRGCWFLAHFGSALGNRPTEADGFTAQFLQRS